MTPVFNLLRLARQHGLPDLIDAVRELALHMQEQQQHTSRKLDDLTRRVQRLESRETT